TPGGQYFPDGGAGDVTDVVALDEVGIVRCEECLEREIVQFLRRTDDHRSVLSQDVLYGCQRQVIPKPQEIPLHGLEIRSVRLQQLTCPLHQQHEVGFFVCRFLGGVLHQLPILVVDVQVVQVGVQWHRDFFYPVGVGFFEPQQVVNRVMVAQLGLCIGNSGDNKFARATDAVGE